MDKEKDKDNGKDKDKDNSIMTQMQISELLTVNNFPMDQNWKSYDVYVSMMVYGSLRLYLCINWWSSVFKWLQAQNRDFLSNGRLKKKKESSFYALQTENYVCWKGRQWK